MPAIGFRIARVPAFAFLLAFTNLTAAGIESSHVTQVAAASNTEIAAPDQPGPFNVGVMVFSATMTGGRTTMSSGVLSDCGTRRARRLLRHGVVGIARCVTESITSAGSMNFNHPCAHVRMPGPCRECFHWWFTIMAAPGPAPTSNESRRFPCTKPWQATVS